MVEIFKNSSIKVKKVFDKTQGEIRFTALAFAIYTLLIPLNSVMNFSGNGTVNRLLGIIVMSSLLVEKFLIKEEIHIKKEHSILLLFFLFVISSYFWSINQSLTFFAISRLFNLIIFYILVSNKSYTSNEKNLIKIMSVIGAVLVSLYLFKTSSLYYTRVIITSSAGDSTDPNGLSSSLAFSAIFLFDYLINSNILIHKIIILASLSIIISGMLLTGSRAGVIGLILGVFILLLFGIKTKKFTKMKVFRFLLSLIILLWVATILNNVFHLIDVNVFKRLTVRNIFETGGTGRFIIWKNAITMFLKKPIFGYGLATDPYLLYLNYGTYIVTHNDALFILLGTGIIGLLTIMWFIATLLKRIFKSRDVLSLSMFFMLLSFSGSLVYIFNKNLWNVFIYSQIGIGVNSNKFNNSRLKYKP